MRMQDPTFDCQKRRLGLQRLGELGQLGKQGPFVDVDHFNTHSFLQKDPFRPRTLRPRDLALASHSQDPDPLFRDPLDDQINTPLFQPY